LDDQTLITRVLAGDSTAAKAIYDRHVDRVYRIAYRLAGDDALAQDWVQETFIRAFDRLSQFRGDSSLATWLTSVATSVALNGLRKVKRSRTSEVELEEAQFLGQDSDADTLDLRARIQRAVDALPEKYRVVFVMYDMEGYSHEEIASSLSISAVASKVQLFRARSMLREQLADLVVRG